MSGHPMDLSLPTSLPEEPRFTNVANAPRALTDASLFNQLPASDKILEYTNLVQRVLSSDNVNMASELKIIIQSIIDLDAENYSIAQELLSVFWASLFETLHPSIHEPLSKFAIEQTEQKEHLKSTSSLIRRALVVVYSRQGRFREGISLLEESLVNTTESDDFKIETYLLILSLTYSTNTPLEKNSYLLKIRQLLKVCDDNYLKFLFFVYFGQSMDFRCRYFNSTLLFLRLNQMAIEDRTEVTRTIRRLAIVGTLLMPVCLIRAENVATLCADRRYHEILPLAILNKFNTFEVIVPEEYKIIEKLLMPHHKADKYNGESVLEYFTCEHNLYSISRVNSCVKLEELENVLNLKPDLVEKVAAKMVSTKRLCAKIENGFIYFKPPL